MENKENVLVTKEIRDAKEREINSKIEALKEKRDSLLENEEYVKGTLRENRRAFKRAKRDYKLQRKEERKIYKANLKAERLRHKGVLQDIYVPYSAAKDKLAVSIKENNEFNSDLSSLRGEIEYLKKQKSLINDMYTSEKEEYIDIDDLPKSM